jgi:hypothetical protein
MGNIHFTLHKLHYIIYTSIFATSFVALSETLLYEYVAVIYHHAYVSILYAVVFLLCTARTQVM